MPWRRGTQDKADAFGAEFGAAKCYGSYEALANDPDVDVVYIGTPHTYHKPNALLCLNAGKHVLCEKTVRPSIGRKRPRWSPAPARINAS